MWLKASVCAVALSTAQPALAEITPVYFGNGCFWGRQKDFVDTEMKLGREMSTATAVVGYAGGKENSKNVCYYYNQPDTLYERQGHAEVVQVGIDSSKAEKEFGMFAETYFKQFKKTPMGMIRLVRPHCTLNFEFRRSLHSQKCCRS
jgi:peptide methionine sulfoxide reductase MsrA